MLGAGSNTLAPSLSDWVIDRPASGFPVNPLMALAERTLSASVSVG